MRARVPHFSGNEKKKMKAEIKFEVDKAWKQMEEQKEHELTRRILKTIICVLHEKHGYGIKRLSVSMNDFTEKLDKSSEDEVYWEHIDRIVIDKLGIPFERDYTDRGRVV